MVEFNGESICIGPFDHLSYWNVERIGKLNIGFEQFDLNVAGISARVNAMAGLGQDPNTGLTHFQVRLQEPEGTLCISTVCAPLRCKAMTSSCRHRSFRRNGRSG